MLCNYPGADTVKKLTSLLSDVGTAYWHDRYGTVYMEFCVRRAAYESLRLLGEEPEEPVMKRHLTTEEYRAYRKQHRN